MITSEQLRAARAALRMEQAALAKKAGVSVETIKRLEAMEGKLRAQLSTLKAVEHALEMEGIEFLDSEWEGPGLRLSKDPTNQLRKDICEEVSGIVESSLQNEIQEDPRFLDRGVNHIADAVMSTMPGMLRLLLPDVLRRHGRKSDT